MFYRLSKDGTLPKHWAYGDAWTWELETEEQLPHWQDNREEGFQVWDSAEIVCCAILGAEMDGDFTPEKYPILLVIKVDQDANIGDGCSFWSTVQCEDVVSVKSVNSARLADLVTNLYESQKDLYKYDTIFHWLSDSEEEVLTFLEATVAPCEIKFVETLPCPFIAVST